MTTRRRVLSAAGAAALLPLAGRPALAAAAGNVVGIAGACTAAGQGQTRALKLGEAVDASDTVTVPADGKLKLRMSDGSVLSLGSGSSLTIATYQTGADGSRQNAQLSLAQGVMRAVVAPVSHQAQFEVSTAVGAAVVRSTDWFVIIQSGAIQVGVLSGSVDLTSAATRRSVEIPARWGARLEAGRDPVLARPWTQAEFDAVINRTNVP